MSNDEVVFAFRGYFIAAAAQSVGEDRWVGVACICTERPATFRAAKALERVMSVGIYDAPAKARQAAEFQARTIVEQLKPNWAPFTEPGAPTR